MPLVDIQLIKGVFTPNQKNTMIQKVTDAMVAVEGEAMRPVTWVRVQEIESGEWAIGGKPLTAATSRRWPPRSSGGSAHLRPAPHRAGRGMGQQRRRRTNPDGDDPATHAYRRK